MRRAGLPATEGFFIATTGDYPAFILFCLELLTSPSISPAFALSGLGFSDSDEIPEIIH